MSKPSNSTSLTPKHLEELIEKQIQEAVFRALAEGGPVQQVVRQTIVQSSYSGPLPVAAETAKFEAILPGFTNRFVTMAETAQKADMAAIERRDKGIIRYQLASLACAVFLGSILLIGGIWLVSINKTLGGFGAIGTAAAAVILAVLRKQKGTPK